MAYACATCAHHLGRQLRDAAELVPELTTALARQTRWAEPGPRPRNSAPAESIRLGLLADPGDDHSGGPAGGLPFSESASIDIGTVQNTVSTWVRVVFEERGQFFVGGLGMALRWLAEQLEWLRHQPYAGEGFDELDDAARLVVRAVDRPANRARIVVGPCPEPDAGGPCRGEVVAIVPTRQDVGAVMRCQRCGVEWSTDQWARAGRRILKLKAEEAAA